MSHWCDVLNKEQNKDNLLLNIIATTLLL